MHCASDIVLKHPDQMPGSPVVLLYGHDGMLMRTRQLILELAGSSSSIVLTADDYYYHLALSQPKVIVFCQTLEQPECSQALHSAAEHSPASQLLLMFNQTPKCSLDRKYTLLDACTGPRFFSKTVSDLLTGVTAEQGSKVHYELGC